ncbi:MAG: hypothetical protein P8Z77_14615 [Candidatus Thiodiazotropha sp.]
MDSDDGDMSYIYRCCAGSSRTFTVSMDDPVGLQGATITSVTLYVSARYLSSPSPSATPRAGGVSVGYQTGTAIQWSASVTTDTSGEYNLISTQTFTTDSDGGTLDLADIGNLQVSIKRDLGGPPELRVTEIRAEVEYTP